jgi:hypothetical protein
MKKHIFENKNYFPALMISFSFLILLVDKEVISSLIKYPLLLIIILFSIYLNPILIIQTFIEKEIKTKSERVIDIFSYMILSVILAVMAIFLFTRNENIMLVAKIVCIVNFIFLIIVYFSKGENRTVLINHLIVSLIFSSLLSIL